MNKHFEMKLIYKRNKQHNRCKQDQKSLEYGKMLLT